jgi:hypothetical protein
MFDRDIICFDHKFCLSKYGAVITSMPESTKSSLKYLMIGSKDLPFCANLQPFRTNHQPGCLFRALLHVPNLQEVMIGPDLFERIDEKSMSTWRNMGRVDSIRVKVGGCKRGNGLKAEEFRWAWNYITFFFEMISEYVESGDIVIPQPKLVSIEYRSVLEDSVVDTRQDHTFAS